MEQKKIISIAGGCFNESENIQNFYDLCKKELGKFPHYDYEFVIAENGSTDDTREKLIQLAAKDPKFKVILNANNFGPIRSGMNALCAAQGDAVILIATDLQDPPELIPAFIEKFEEGYEIVCGIKKASMENKAMFLCRSLYYYLLDKISDIPMLRNFTGYGLYSRKALNAIKKYNDFSFFRGTIAEIGFKRAEIPFVQPLRKHGKSSYNFFRYYDYAMTGFVNYTKLPLRLSLFAGFFTGFFSILIAIGYLFAKLICWDSFNMGTAPIVIGMFFLGGVQLFFLGIVGEYIGAIWSQVKNKPLVIEEGRINFD